MALKYSTLKSATTKNRRKPRRAECAPLRDYDIRARLLMHLREQHPTDTLIIEEMGLCQGNARVDVAVANGELAGYEIKSDRDTFRRLFNQCKHYEACFDSVTIVVGSSHLEAAKTVLPRFWGILEAIGCGNQIKLFSRRKPRRNANIQSDSLVRLLWKQEVIAALGSVGITVDAKKMARPELWEMLVRNMPLSGVRDFVREAIKARGDWRSAKSPFQCGDSGRCVSTSQEFQANRQWLLSHGSSDHLR